MDTITVLLIATAIIFKLKNVLNFLIGYMFEKQFDKPWQMYKNNLPLN